MQVYGFNGAGGARRRKMPTAVWLGLPLARIDGQGDKDHSDGGDWWSPTVGWLENKQKGVES